MMLIGLFWGCLSKRFQFNNALFLQQVKNIEIQKNRENTFFLIEVFLMPG
jgi:hypothetical protein